MIAVHNLLLAPFSSLSAEVSPRLLLALEERPVCLAFTLMGSGPGQGLRERLLMTA